MIKVHRALQEGGYRSRLILQVHDELLIEAYKEEKDAVAKILKENMEHAADLLVPLDVDVHEGASWFEAKKEGKRNEGNRFDRRHGQR